jgi:hypothetical protein
MAAEDRTEPAVLAAFIYCRLGLATETFEWLQRAVERKSTPIYIVVFNSDFRVYFDDPRYHAFLASIGLSRLTRS